MTSAYRRVLLKLSGEALMDGQAFGLSEEALSRTAEEIGALQKQGYEVAVVLGGGNLFRGAEQGPALNMERTSADQIGMLSTLINGIALKSALARRGYRAHMYSALECPKIAESYQWDRVISCLEAGEIVLFVGGIGHPYFTTDTNAALRACEIRADILLKATVHVGGVYDKDPRQHPGAVPYVHMTFQEALERQLGIMDLAAVSLCARARIPIRVFNFRRVPLISALTEQEVGTLISE